jgi:hypothetical protein
MPSTKSNKSVTGRPLSSDPNLIAAAARVIAAATGVVAVASSVIILLGLLALARYAWTMEFRAVLAIALGALGGLVHELAQSKGSIFFPQKRADGEFYLGSMSGLVLGATAGILAVQSILTVAPTASSLTGPTALYFLAFSAFTAGLALKGIAEAVTTSPASDVAPIGTTVPRAKASPTSGQLATRLAPADANDNLSLFLSAVAAYLERRNQPS